MALYETWLPMILKTVQKEYKSSPVAFKPASLSEADYSYVIQRGSEESSFDTLSLKRNMTVSLEKGEATLQKYSSSLGVIYIVSPHLHSWKDPPLELWSRAIRILSPNKPVKVIIFASLQKRIPPPIGYPIGPEHINGGFTIQCDPGSVVIYRREEATRVLIHELFHASCSDPKTNIPTLEGDTEAWAEILLCCLKSEGKKEAFLRLFKKQITYAVSQALSCQKYHMVFSSKDYAWRYLFGRIDTWKQLGFSIPDVLDLSPPKTLRLTCCDV